MKITKDNVSNIDLDSLFDHIKDGGKIDIAELATDVANDVVVPLIQRLIEGRAKLRKRVTAIEAIIEAQAVQIEAIKEKLNTL